MTPAGRTVWQAQDAAWWQRERIVDLGEEFGPAGPAVANWLECAAKLQNDGGQVKAGYRAVARGAFLAGGADEAERIIRHAVEIGFLKDFDEGTRTFTAHISAYTADQGTGKAALRQSAKRDRDQHDEATAGNQPAPAAPARDKSRPVTLGHAPVSETGQERREQKDSLRSSTARGAATSEDDDQTPDDFPDQLAAVLDDVLVVLQRIAAARGANAVTCRAAARAIATYPRRPHLEAAQDLEHWLVDGTGRSVKVRDVVGFYRNQLRDRWQDRQTTRPAGGPPRRPHAVGDPEAAERRARRGAALTTVLSTPPGDAAA